MTVTFPHLGNAYICVKALLDDMEIKYLVPPFNSKRTLELGARIVPESACLPLKITVGNLIEAYELGADTILMVGGKGPCRFGYYCEMQREILNDTGHKMDLVTLEAPNGDIAEFVRRVKKLTGSFNPYKLLKAFLNTARIARRVDELETLCRRLRPREKKRGTVDRIYADFRKRALTAFGEKGVNSLIDETEKRLLGVEVKEDARPLRVAIVGEIYTSIEHFANFNIEQKLGRLGIEADKKITVSQWIYEHMIKKPLGLMDTEFAREATPYLGTMIGGHAQETVGNSVLYAKKGYDGIIQVYPLTCMPEIVAESILPSVERDFEVPVLTLILDEMTGEEGFVTRLEAFADLIEQRASEKTGGKAGFAPGKTIHGY